MRILVIIFSLLFSLKGFAQQARGDYFLLGAGAGIKQNNRVDNNLSNYKSGVVFSPYPLASVKVGRLSANGYSARYTLGGGPLAIGAMIKWQGDPYRTEYIEQRRSSFFGGISGRLLFLSFSYLADLNNKSQGQVGEIGLAQRVVWGKHLFQVFKLGREYNNRKYLNYYYGVKQSEAVTMAQYKPGSGWGSFAAMSSHLKFGQGLGGMMTFKYRYLSDEAYHSPTTKRRTQWLGALMLHYRF